MLSAPGFEAQFPVTCTFAGYPLAMPSQHPLLRYGDPASPHHQPYREAGLILTARALGNLGRGGTALDIGANVGDSCAIIHRHSNLDILCIEASDFFFSYLTENIKRHFSPRATARQAFVLAGANQAPKGLLHWDGTAKAVDRPFTEACSGAVIADILAATPNAALVKLDIDGMDLDVIAAALAVPGFHAPLFFELEMPDNALEGMRHEAARALSLFDAARHAGYGIAFVWDDRGRFFGRFDLADLSGLANAINYMGHPRQRPVFGYDICLVHREDENLAAEMQKLLAVEAVAPLP